MGGIGDFFSDFFSFVPNEVWRGLRSALDAVARQYGIPLADLRALARKLKKEHPEWTDEDVARAIDDNPQMAVGASGATENHAEPFLLVAAVLLFMAFKGKF